MRGLGWSLVAISGRRSNAVPTPVAINFQYSSSKTSRRLRPGRPTSTRSF
jgi:hypothetical protein